MKLRGKFKDASVNFDGSASLVFTTTDITAVKQVADDMRELELDIEVSKHRDKRSLQANRLLWECIGRIATARKDDKWDVYLQMLRKWGKFTYVDIIAQAVEEFKAQWRECIVVGEHETNGIKYVELLCCFGSSRYNTEEFSNLLDGIMHEMEADGIPIPTSTELEEALKNWRPDK